MSKHQRLPKPPAEPDAVQTAPADPEQWSEKSKNTMPYQFNWVKVYTDKAYVCWTCKARCVFSATDQKFTYEVRKAYIDQKRTLCTMCWGESNRIMRQIQACEQQWAEARQVLRTDRIFLETWLALLQHQTRYRAYYAGNVAHENMLKKLLGVMPSREEM
jgi:hypothetical protein